MYIRAVIFFCLRLNGDGEGSKLHICNCTKQERPWAPFMQKKQRVQRCWQSGSLQHTRTQDTPPPFCSEPDYHPIHTTPIDSVQWHT
uniref:Secreted protein n=1 Tax=Knipowitschia caucasica TaxID=637954 RepID=A0AAV2K3Q7_KNICA